MKSYKPTYNQLKAEIYTFVMAIKKSKSVYETDFIVGKYCDKWRKYIRKNEKHALKM